MNGVSPGRIAVPPGTLVLVAEDDASVSAALVRCLRVEGYRVVAVADGAEVVGSVAEHDPDVVVLDVMMPNVNGFEACQELRARGLQVPVLMLTARDAVQDRVYGLDSGADDYLLKPFALDELMARLRVLVRRHEVISGTRLTYADLTVDVNTREVLRGTREVILTKLEFGVLELLVENPRRVISRTQIVDRVWDDQAAPSDNALDVVVSGLRRKLEEGAEPRLLQTVRGIGYALREMG